MKITIRIVAASIALVAASPALAGGLFDWGGHGDGRSSSSGGPTSVPEPSDAVLVLMGAAGVIIGRRLHARAKRGD